MPQDAGAAGQTSDVLLERLLFAIDKGKANAIRRAGLKESLLTLKHTYETEGPHRTLAEQRRRKRLLQKMQAYHAGLRKLRELLGPYGRQEIAQAEWRRTNLKPKLRAIRNVTPTENEKSFDAEVREKLEKFRLLEQLEAAEDLAIGTMIKEMQAGYKKDPIRKVVIEPFLLILDVYNMWERAQPRTNVMKALFDWLGVEKKYRPTDTGVRAIAREFRRNILPNQRWLFAKGRKLVKIYDWRCKTVARRLEAVRLKRARVHRLLKIMNWRLKAVQNKLGIPNEEFILH